MNKVFLNHNNIMHLADIVASQIVRLDISQVKIYPIPRGGIPAVYAVMATGCGMERYAKIVLTPEEADCFVDDIIDSGETMRKYCDQYPGKPFFALIDKTDPKCEYKDEWICFPWEGEEVTGGIEDNIRRVLQYIGEDPARGGLLETPKRVAKAYGEWFSGYGKNPADILKCFEDGADGCDEMVIAKNIPFYTFCEHHMAPFFGTATVTYIPNGKKIVGLSKVSRIVDIFARRLQVQERLTNQIADAIWEGLTPKGVGVIITARHLCMESRGICQQGHTTITSALRGVLKENAAARAEFMSLANK